MSVYTWARSSAAERAAHNRLVAGSNPAGPTKKSLTWSDFFNGDFLYWLKSYSPASLVAHKAKNSAGWVIVTFCPL